MHVTRFDVPLPRRGLMGRYQSVLNLSALMMEWPESQTRLWEATRDGVIEATDDWDLFAALSIITTMAGLLGMGPGDLRDFAATVTPPRAEE